MDVCQSVLKSFFVRTAAGQFDLDEPDQLVRLLVTMTRNKLASEARRQHRRKRDNRRAGGDAALGVVPAAGPTPSRMVPGRELVDQVRGRLTAEERELADLRAQGLSWEEIAARVGGKAQARRVQFGRAIGRVAREMNLDGDGNG
jgi:RNA polymerase sigma-70 factor (ECF subfamily)